jgi:hypothetical protein
MSLPIVPFVPEHEIAAWREDAKDKTKCTEWLHRCNAACCSQFSFPDEGQDLTKKYLIMKVAISVSMIKYYELHRCNYVFPHLQIPTRKAVRKDGRIYILEKCKYLKDNKCIAHNTNRQPDVCRDFTLQNYLASNLTHGAQAINTCLFKFKKEQYEGMQHEENKI